MKRQAAKYLLFIFVLFVAVTVFRRWFSFSYWPFWVGGLLGIFLPGIDHIIYVYLLRPQELTPQRIKAYIKTKQFRAALVLLYDTVGERVNLVFHTAFFQVIFLVLTFLVATSSGSIFGKGLVTAASLHLLIDQLNDLSKVGNINRWFAANPLMGEISLTNEKQKAYWVIILLLILFISLFV